MSDHLVDMKLTKKQAKNENEMSVELPKYPFGLSINLDDESLKKLGFDSLPDVGDEFIVVGIGPVKSVRASENENGSDRSFSIQLQKLEVGPADTGGIKSAEDAVSAGIKQADAS